MSVTNVKQTNETAPTIAIIRPPNQALKDSATCSHLGFQSLVVPPIVLRSNEDALAQLPAQMQNVAAVFWVSPGAVELASSNKTWLESAKKLPHIATGKASAAALKALGLRNLHYPREQNDSEGVAKLAVWQQLQVAHNAVDQAPRVLFVRATEGRDWLINHLKKRGFDIDIAAIYEREAATISPLEQQTLRENTTLQAAYITTFQAAKWWFAQIGQEAAEKLIYLTQNEKIAQQLKQLGAIHVLTGSLKTTLPALRNSIMSQNHPTSNEHDQSLNNQRSSPENNTNNQANTAEHVTENAAKNAEKSAAKLEKLEKLEKATENVQVASLGLPAEAQASHRDGKGLAVGALVLSILALGAAGLLFVEGQNLLRNQEIEFEHKITSAGLNQTKNAAIAETNMLKIQDLDRDLMRQKRELQLAWSQVQNMQNAFSELNKTRSARLMGEAETALNLAAQQLLIANNIPAALRLLDNLQLRLSNVESPELLALRRALALDIQALKELPHVDTAALSFRLNRLEENVQALPLAADSLLQSHNNQQDSANADDQLPLWKQWLARLTNGLKSLVEVRKVNTSDAALIAPEQMFFVRENLRLRLIDARLALLQRQHEIYLSDLNASDALMKRYFDLNSPAVQHFLSEINALVAINLQAREALSLPNHAISVIQEYRKLSRTEPAFSLPPAASVNIEPKAAAKVDVKPEPKIESKVEPKVNVKPAKKVTPKPAEKAAAAADAQVVSPAETSVTVSKSQANEGAHHAATNQGEAQ